MKSIFTKIKGSISNFFKNLKVIVRVQKGALIRVLGEFILPILTVALGVASVADGADGAWEIAFIISLVLWTLIKLAVLRHDYKKVVKEVAQIEIKKSNKDGFKRRKKAEKHSKASQDRFADASRIDTKYN